MRRTCLGQLEVDWRLWLYWFEDAMLGFLNCLKHSMASLDIVIHAYMHGMAF
jgi:hypothetical protein